MVLKPPVTGSSKANFAVLLVLGVTHMLNDMMQSLIPASYPILKDAYDLDFVQIGLITLTFQIAGSFLQPIVGMVTDRYPAPYSPVVGMMFTCSGLVCLSFASSYTAILVSVSLIGIGSSVYHPEATKIARFAAGRRQGLAQGIFQVGGQAGGSLGPIMAAFIIVPWGQPSLAVFGIMALLSLTLLVWIGRRQDELRTRFLSARILKVSSGGTIQHTTATVALGVFVLTVLMFSKAAYSESFRSFYIFYLMDRFDLPVTSAQIMLFIFMLTSVFGVLIGGMVGDRIGRRRIIWISVLGPLPFTLVLPHVDLLWTGVLTILINLVMASAFASILLYAIELMPNRIGLVAGLFYGLNFGLGGVAAALLGLLADSHGVVTVYTVCSFLPLAGLLVWFLPDSEPV